MARDHPGHRTHPPGQPGPDQPERRCAMTTPAAGTGTAETDPTPTDHTDGESSVLVAPVADPGTEIPGPVTQRPRADASSVTAAHTVRTRVRSGRVTLVLLALPAFVAIW